MRNEFNQEVGELLENWEPIKRPAKKILSGNYCTLDPIHLNQHAEKLFENLSNNNAGESWTYLPYGPFANCADFSEWLQKTNSDPDTQLYLILNKQNQPDNFTLDGKQKSKLNASVDIPENLFSK